MINHWEAFGSYASSDGMLCLHFQSTSHKALPNLTAFAILNFNSIRTTYIISIQDADF